MAIKKYKYDTKTDTITTLPATIIGDGTPISSYTIKGNMEQNGTPTPISPIYPSECGERTENLFDKGNYNLIRANAGTGNNILYGDPSVSPYAVYIPVTGGETYSFYSQATLTSSCFTMETPAVGVSIVLNGANTFGSENVRTAPADAKYLVMFLELASVTQDRLDSDLATLIVVKSSTAPTSYEPYGYKLPLALGSTTTDIYLGEVQSTRRVKKLVLDGTEDWSVYNSGASTFFYTSVASSGLSIIQSIVSSHFVGATISTNNTDVGIQLLQTRLRIRPESVASTTITDFKAFLAQQYANGTPVTVWHVLTEPTTGIVNEPLRKIGDYVDSVSGAGLATSGTAQEFDVGTTLKPSEVDMTYRRLIWVSSVPCRKYTKSKNSNNSWVDVPSYTRTNGAWVRDSDTWCYGFKVLKTSDDPDLKVEYLEDAVGMTPGSMGSTSFNFGSWLNAPFMPRPCMLNFDGTVAYYLSMDDYSKKADGTPSDVSNFDFNGNAMAEYGLLWYKFSDGDENTEFEFRVSNKKLDDDFVCHCNTDSHNDIIDHFYVPIYNGTTAPTYDSTATYDVGAHAVYDGKEYRCTTAVETAEAFDNSKWDLVSNTPRMRSLSGVQLTPANGNGQTSGTEEIARAEACNVGADKEWFIDTLCDHELITMLHVLVAKSLDCQAKFGQGISSGSQTVKEAYVTGSLDDKGSFYGSTSATTIAVKTFCRENFWALVWRRLAGLVGSSGNFLYKLTPNTADGSTATSYNTNGSGYLNGGVRPASGYIKNLKRSTDSFLPSTTVGASVGTKDYYYDGNGYALVGGTSSSGANDGPFSFNLYIGVSNRTWYISGSPSCKPCKNKTL